MQPWTEGTAAGSARGPLPGRHGFPAAPSPRTLPAAALRAPNAAGRERSGASPVLRELGPPPPPRLPNRRRAVIALLVIERERYLPCAPVLVQKWTLLKQISTGCFPLVLQPLPPLPECLLSLL